MHVSEKQTISGLSQDGEEQIFFIFRSGLSKMYKINLKMMAQIICRLL